MNHNKYLGEAPNRLEADKFKVAPLLLLSILSRSILALGAMRFNRIHEFKRDIFRELSFVQLIDPSFDIISE